MIFTIGLVLAVIGKIWAIATAPSVIPGWTTRYSISHVIARLVFLAGLALTVVSVSVEILAWRLLP